jgi:hypothetical protein
MTYAVDLTTLLKSLFDDRPRDELGLTWSHLKRAYDTYEGSGPRRKIHRQICATFQQDQQILDKDRFEGMYVELLKGEGSHWDVNRIADRSAQDARVSARPLPAQQSPATAQLLPSPLPRRRLSRSPTAYLQRLFPFRSGSPRP